MGLLEGKTALITGAARGIGKAIALKFAEEGANIAFTDLEVNEETEKEIAAKGVKAKSYASNAADFAQTEEVVKAVKEEFGSIDVLVNNAGIAIDTTFEDKTVSNFRRTLDVNLIGPFVLSRLVGDIMYKKKKGSIINVSSTNGIDTTYPESVDYDASKAALISLTHNLAKEYAPYVRVNTICPGWVNTDMNKDLTIGFMEDEKQKILLNRFANPEEIADVIYKISTSTYMNDSIIRVDGGQK